MKRHYHEFKTLVANLDYDTVVDIDLLSIESIEDNDITTLLHMDSGMHINVYGTKKEVMEIINSVNE